MLFKELLDAGGVEATLSRAQDDVRKDPTAAKNRVYLFQLLSVLGRWDRALTQLNVVGEMDAEALPMVQAYRMAINCETYRDSVFAGERAPMLFGEPEQWIALLMQAVQLSGKGQFAQAQQLIEQAYADAPATTGRLSTSAEEADGDAFEWIADGDSRLGPILEAFVNGRYYWVPYHRIKTVTFEPPSDLRDLVWTPAQFEWANEGQSVGFIPTRYPGSASSEDDFIRLSRKTEWREEVPSLYCGSGQRMLATDAGEYALMDLRRIELDSAVDES
jgi:type VI secretion system protein ImpE